MNLQNKTLSQRISDTLFKRNFMECPCRDHKQEYSLLNKRLKYSPEKDYFKPKDLFGDLANFMLMAEMKYQIDLEKTSAEEVQKTHQRASARGLMWSLISTLEAKPNNLPIYKIPSQTLTKFLQTRASEKVILQHLKPTLSQGLLLLPTNSPSNYNLNWIYFEYNECQCENPDCQIGGIYCLSVFDGMVYFATRLILNQLPLELEINHWHTSIAALKKFQTLFNPYLDPLLFLPLEIETNRLFNRWKKQIDIDDYCYFITTVVVNFLLFSQTDSQEISSKPSSFGGRKKRSQKNFVPTHTFVLPPTSALNFNSGSNNNLTPHLRCGHWRNQPFGSRSNPQYRLQWIEPVWVGISPPNPLKIN